MTHQFRDKKERTKRTRTMRIAIGCTFFVLMAAMGLFIWTSPILSRLGLPLWKAQTTAVQMVADQAYHIRTKASVFAENETLTKENTELKMTMLDYQILKDENIQLKELMGRTDPKHSFVLAAILVKPNHSPYDTIIIDGGSEAGMLENQDVYADAIVPIGRISKVYIKTALVTLYSTPAETTEAMLEGSNASVTLIGRGGGNFEMTVPIDVATDQGTPVVVPGVSSEIIARIQEVISIPTDPVKKVILSSPVNIQNLKWVEVKKY